MELRYVDPKTITHNPSNPRKVQAGRELDEQLTASIREIGLIQPPIAREIDGALVIRAGDRRLRSCIAIGLERIPVLVMDEESDVADSMRAFAENYVREGFVTVDIYRAMQALSSEGWTDDALATALNFSPRLIKRIKLCGSILPAILDHMATGDEPDGRQMRVIAQAPLDDQTQAWKRHKPKKGEQVLWWELARALEKRRMWARDARFGDDLVQAYGIVWVEDLFEQADQDNRYTTQVDAFLGAQHEWMANNLPKKAVILQTDDSGQPKLPAKATKIWGRAGKGAITGHYIREQDGAVQTIAYQMPVSLAKKTSGKGTADAGVLVEEEAVNAQSPSNTRAPITQTGLRIIGDLQTDALHEAISTAEIDDVTLLGMFVLAASGRNVEVRSGDTAVQSVHGARNAIAADVVQGGVLVRDPEAVRAAARRMLRYMLSLRQTNWNANSGLAARVAGEAIGATGYLSTMATDEFLTCLSKAEMERVASANNVLPRQTGKATRAAFVEHFREEHFIYDEARFQISTDEAREFDADSGTGLGDDESDDAGEGDEPDDGDPLIPVDAAA